jgi:molecular chaperone DnaK (HSP70)
VLSLVNEGTAATVDYFLSRDIKEEQRYVIIYDMGDVSTKATLVSFEQVRSDPKDPKVIHC